MKLTAIDPWAGAGRGFNRQAAEVVYKAMSGMDADTALMYGRMLVAGGVQYDLIAHRDELAKVAQQVVDARAGKLREHYSRTAVAKARRGQDNTHEISCLVQIGKAFDFTSDQQRRWANAQSRGSGGRFVQEHTRINTNEGKGPKDQDRAEKVEGIPQAGNLEGADLAHYQQAYAQIQDMLSPFHGKNLDAQVHLNIRGRDGEVRTKIDPIVGAARALPGHLTPGDRIETVAVSINPSEVNSTSSAVNVMAVAGMPRTGGYVGDAMTGGALDTERLKTFNTARQTVGENEPYSMASRNFGRVQRGAELLSDSLGENPPAKLQYALSVANHVGQFGPEAQKVIGPAADRAAYRYRGTERTPAPALMRGIRSLREKGLQGQALRRAAVEGTEGEAGPNSWNPGPVLRYFYDQLPNPDLNELQRRSGVIPPSEGIIIARDGHVAAQSVGYADDWYLPFNLRHLASLKGGEYVRTRSFGGPTTEDIYTALVGGAQSLTVVSHNGVYTMHFDKNLRGGRRFNDKAARMVGRYGQLLDALRSDQVERGGISPSREEELRTEALRYEPDDTTAAFTAKMKELHTVERRKPTLSEQEKGEAAVDWLRESAAGYVTNGDRTMMAPELTQMMITQKAKTDYLAYKEKAASVGQRPDFTEADYRQMVADKVVGSPAQQVAILAEMDGRTGSLERAMKTAEATNRDRVQPLRLDGKGYNDALTALHEQFPYYIDKPIYHPWRGATGITTTRTLESLRDTGYVLPQHNRPEQAESGYFSPGINQQQKVRADSTRYQNFRVQGGKVTPMPDRNKKPDTDTAGKTGTAATGVAAADMKRVADMEMLDELLAQTHFSTGATVSGVDSGGNTVRIDVGGDNIRDTIKMPLFPNKAIARLFDPSKTRAQLEAMSDLPSLMDQILNAASGPDKLFANLNKTKVSAYNLKGAIAEPTEAPAELGSMLREIDQDHKYGGIAYDVKREATPDAIRDAYLAHPTIEALVATGDLPRISDPDFDSKFDAAFGAVKSRLEAVQAESVRRTRMSAAQDPRAMAQAKKEAEGLNRAAQLRRRFVDAVKHVPKPAEAVEQQLGDSYQNGVSFPGFTPKNMADLTPDERDAMKANIDYVLNQRGPDPDARKVIKP